MQIRNVTSDLQQDRRWPFELIMIIFIVRGGGIRGLTVRRAADLIPLRNTGERGGRTCPSLPTRNEGSWSARPGFRRTDGADVPASLRMGRGPVVLGSTHLLSVDGSLGAELSKTTVHARWGRRA